MYLDKYRSFFIPILINADYFIFRSWKDLDKYRSFHIPILKCKDLDKYRSFDIPILKCKDLDEYRSFDIPILMNTDLLIIRSRKSNCPSVFTLSNLFLNLSKFFRVDWLNFFTLLVNNRVFISSYTILLSYVFGIWLCLHWSQLYFLSTFFFNNMIIFMFIMYALFMYFCYGQVYWMSRMLLE